MLRTKQLLQEIIDAAPHAELPLDMRNFYNCGTSCCLCGDVAVSRYGDLDANENEMDSYAVDFSIELDVAFGRVFGSRDLAKSIYCGEFEIRAEFAKDSGVLSDIELNHPHLTTNHNDRDIAHSYLRLIMTKIDKLGTE